MEIIVYEKLTESKIAELIAYKEQLETEKKLHYKLEKSGFYEESSKVLHLIAEVDGKVVAFARINHFEPEEIEITILMNQNLFAVEEFLNKIELFVAASSVVKRILFVVDEKDRCLISWLKTKNCHLVFSEYGMLLEFGTQLPSVSNPLELSVATDKDAVQIENLWNETKVVEASAETKKDLKKTFVYKRGEQVLASLRLEKDFNRISIYGFVVLKQERGKGLGRKVLQAAVQLIQQQGKDAYLEVETTNQRAYQLYCTMGFKKLAHYQYYQLNK